MKTLPFRIIERAKGRFEPGYLEAVLAAGSREGDLVSLDYDAYMDLARRFQRPGLAARAGSAAAAGARWAGAGFPVVTSEQEAQRKATCLACDFWDAKALLGLGNCRLCGCTRLKWNLSTERCPANKWPVN